MLILLSSISFVAFLLYLYVGFYAYRLNKQSEICKIFLLLCISMSIWSFAWVFLYVAATPMEYSFWNKLSSIGWCTLPSWALYIILVITENKRIKNWFVKLLIFLPAISFLYMSLFLFGPNINTSKFIETFFYISNFLHNFIYLLVSIILLFIWGKKSKHLNNKKQANIIVICSIIPFLLTLIIQNILPMLGGPRIPSMGQIYSLIMLWGVYYAIVRFEFMSIPESLLTKELFNELTGITFLIDTNGCIIKTNKQFYKLLNYSENEILNSSVLPLLINDDLKVALQHYETIKETTRFQNSYIRTKSGELTPFDISVTPLFSSKSSLCLGLLIVGQDTSITKILQEESSNHKHTYKKLKNSEELFRTIIEIVPFAIVLTSRSDNKILYINHQAEIFFKTERSYIIGRDAIEFYKDPNDRLKLIEDLNQNKSVNEREIIYLQQDGSEILGLITMVLAIYQDQEVALSCISDITERKFAEIQLKQKNEKIQIMNKELLEMNDILVNKSIRDSLTSLYNHQYINEMLQAKITEKIASNYNLCIMMLDIDFFKRVNDTYGHQVGDSVLIQITKLIIDNTRRTDLIGRYGGEEFVVVLPDINLMDAYQIAERIRLSIQNYDFGIDDLSVTISIGLAQHFNENANSFINRADTLLYQAKSNGRNRVEL